MCTTSAAPAVYMWGQSVSRTNIWVPSAKPQGELASSTHNKAEQWETIVIEQQYRNGSDYP